MSKGALLVLLTALCSEGPARPPDRARLPARSRRNYGSLTETPRSSPCFCGARRAAPFRATTSKLHRGRNRDPGRRFRQGYSAVQSRAIGEVRRKRVRSRLHRRGACPRRPLAYAVPAGPDSREMRLRASLKVQRVGLDTGLRRGQISVGMHHSPFTDLVRKKAGSGRYPPTARSESIRQP